MKMLPRTEFGNPILRTKAKIVPLKSIKNGEYKDLIRQMIFTMRKTHGVGLAAPQIGVSLRIAVMELRPTKVRPNLEQKGPLVIINPKILSYSSAKKSDWEGCLSFFGVRVGAVVPRPASILVEYYDETGQKVVEKASGIWARIFQHEIDHLNGVVYVDRMKDAKALITRGEFVRRRSG